jgi:hypothetical protein
VREESEGSKVQVAAANPEMPLQYGLVSGVHDARSCPNLRVVMRVNVVPQEIDQAAPLLAASQES